MVLKIIKRHVTHLKKIPHLPENILTHLYLLQTLNISATTVTPPNKKMEQTYSRPTFQEETVEHSEKYRLEDTGGQNKVKPLKLRKKDGLWKPEN